MNYIVFDLEFNQAWDLVENKSRPNSKCPFEIIQIGAVKLDEKLQVISSFDRLVKPKLYTSLHPFVKQITGIEIEDVENAKTFGKVYREFVDFIGIDCILCVWGTADITELIRNVQYHKLNASAIPKEYINIQMYASKHLQCIKGTNVGLRNAVELLNIPIDKKFHDALGDACYTAEVFKRICSDSIKPALYKPNREKRLGRSSEVSKLDTDKLVRQFEKMYDRQMTDEEQSIIKLAYLMGRTNQFRTGK